MQSNISRVIETLHRGGMVLIADSEDREYEIDLACSARHVTTEIVNLCLRKASGVLCVAMDPAHAAHMGLRRLRHNEKDMFETPFGDPVSFHSNGCSPVSLEGRQKTILELSRASASVANFVVPGHVQTLIAHAQGIVARQGHTEAIVELLKMAGEAPVGVLCEMVGVSGGMISSFDEARDLLGNRDIPAVHISEIYESAMAGNVASGPGRKFTHENAIRLEKIS